MGQSGIFPGSWALCDKGGLRSAKTRLDTETPCAAGATSSTSRPWMYVVELKCFPGFFGLPSAPQMMPHRGFRAGGDVTGFGPAMWACEKV
jgi:hypothetical protein